MKTPRIVLPFRPFPPESPLHQELADFDWIAAMRMLSHTAQLTCRWPVEVITDVDTDLPLPSLKYETHQRRLMLWNLEVIGKYVESTDFDRDTVIMDSDQLIYQDLAPFFKPGIVDLTVLIRPNKSNADHDRFPILNGVVFARKRGRKAIKRFYQEALSVAENLPDDRIVWGADTDALRILLEPLEVGISYRNGLWVEMLNSNTVLEAISERHTEGLKTGDVPWPIKPVADFRWRRKRYMADYYKATILAKAVA